MDNDMTIIAQNPEEVLEVVLTDVHGEEHVYWVDMGACPDPEDPEDWATAKARAFHDAQGLVTIPEDTFDDDDEMQCFALASEPFSREPDEYTLIS